MIDPWLANFAQASIGRLPMMLRAYALQRHINALGRPQSRTLDSILTPRIKQAGKWAALAGVVALAASLAGCVDSPNTSSGIIPVYDHYLNSGLDQLPGTADDRLIVMSKNNIGGSGGFYFMGAEIGDQNRLDSDIHNSGAINVTYLLAGGTKESPHKILQLDSILSESEYQPYRVKAAREGDIAASLMIGIYGTIILAIFGPRSYNLFKRRWKRI